MHFSCELRGRSNAQPYPRLSYWSRCTMYNVQSEGRGGRRTHVCAEFLGLASSRYGPGRCRGWNTVVSAHTTTTTIKARELLYGMSSCKSAHEHVPIRLRDKVVRRSCFVCRCRPPYIPAFTTVLNGYVECRGRAASLPDSSSLSRIVG